MKVNKKLRVLHVVLTFILLIIVVIFGFLRMRQRTAQLNEETVEDIGMTYLSALTTDTVSHSQTYFEGRFDIMRQVLENSLHQAESPEEFKEMITDNITSGAQYVALLTADGQREVLRGDPILRPYDNDSFQEQIKSGMDKVLLTTKDNDERMIEMMLASDFTVGGTDYKALLCDISVSTFKETLIKSRLTALHAIYLQIFRHITQKLLAIRQYACVVFMQSDEKSDCVSDAQDLISVSLMICLTSPMMINQWYIHSSSVKKTAALSYATRTRSLKTTILVSAAAIRITEECARKIT